MKYYTKAWYELMQGPGNFFRRLPDADYSDADVEMLYQKKLKKAIADAKKDYNTEPFFLPLEDQLTDEEYNPEDWLFVDEETGNLRKPLSVEEVRESLKAERQQAQEDFENRPPFDSTETVQMFEEEYRMALENCTYNFPGWLTDSVDHRLMALGYLPQTAYNRYRQENQEKQKKWESICRAAEKALKKQKVSEEVNEALYLHDAYLLSLKKQGKNLIMVVTKDGYWPDDPTPYRKVVFKNAEVLEKEEGLSPRKYLEDKFYLSNVNFLTHELYEKDGIYEAHMLFITPKGLSYFTVRCRDILYKDGIEFS